MSLQVTDNGEILVHAPYFTKQSDIDAFVEKNHEWIQKRILKQTVHNEIFNSITKEDEKRLKELAYEYLTRHTYYFASLMGVTPKKITITSAKKRFGSCNGKNEICYSCYLMLYPPSAIDYVCVHELAHIKHHNHSRRFHEFVQRFMPEENKLKKLLCDENIDLSILKE